MEACFSFLGEWYDEQSDLTHNFQIYYYPESNKVQILDTKKNKIILRKIEILGLDLYDFYPGNKIEILSRKIIITDYADKYTKESLEKESEITFAMIKPHCIQHISKTIEYIENAKLRILHADMIQMTPEQAEELYVEHQNKVFYLKLISYVTSGPVLIMKLQGENVVEHWKQLIGNANPQVANEENPFALRAQFGENEIRNGFHGSETLQVAIREANIFYPDSTMKPTAATLKSSATMNNCTCCIIKPHVVQEGKLARIIAEIENAGFKITAFRSMKLNIVNARKFLSIYDGVVPEYTQMVIELTVGQCVALEIVQNKLVNDDITQQNDLTRNIVDQFRQFAGPTDPILCNLLRPETLRAKFGENIVQNAIHCTDLESEGVMEVETIFTCV